MAILVLLAQFLMLRSALLRAQFRIYAVQSLLVSITTGVVALGSQAEGLTWSERG